MSDFDAFRHGLAWELEPPILVQVRNLLAQLLSLTANQAGNNTHPSDFIPTRETPEEELERQRSEMLLWAQRCNASLQ